MTFRVRPSWTRVERAAVRPSRGRPVALHRARAGLCNGTLRIAKLDGDRRQSQVQVEEEAPGTVLEHDELEEVESDEEAESEDEIESDMSEACDSESESE